MSAPGGFLDETGTPPFSMDTPAPGGDCSAMSETTEIPRSVAIVGRPNVGKSRLFNRLVGRRVSIVHDMPGVTRDLITEQVRDGNYLLMDTGGIGLFTTLTPKVIADAVEEQVGFAINAAKVILLVVDVNEGCAPLDLEIAHKLRRFGKQVILVANKADNEARAANQSDFFQMGLGSPVLVSAEHGTGTPFLISKLKTALDAGTAADAANAAVYGGSDSATAQAPAAPRANRVRLCLAGRPNVGKSSIGNRLLNASRLVVSEIPGTTRDPVRVLLSRPGAGGAPALEFELVDTAGRRARTRQDALDYYSTLRSDEVLAVADVVFLVLDAQSGVTRMDKQLAGQVVQDGAGLVIVVNKWDLALASFTKKGGGIEGFQSEDEFRKKYLEAIRRELFFLPDAPVLFTSATSGMNIGEMLTAAAGVHTRQTGSIPTGRLNKAIHDLMENQPPRMVSGKRFKCYYAVQAGVKPVRIRLFCNSKERVDTAYSRYLLAGLRKIFELSGVAIELEYIGKPKDPERGFFAPQRADDLKGAKSTKPAHRSGAGKSVGKQNGKPRSRPVAGLGSRPATGRGAKTGTGHPAKRGSKPLSLKARSKTGRARR